MKVQFSPEFHRLYKKANVRIRNEVDKKITIFEKDPFNSELNNHSLQDEYEGLRSINITNDYRAVYEEIKSGKEDNTAYFLILGTHKELYTTTVFKIKFKK